MLSSPSLAAISDISAFEGAAYPLALQGYDADGDALTYTITSSNTDALEVIQTSSSNRTLEITMEGFGDDGSDGVMTFQLFEDLAPETTARIIELAQEGFYNNLTFHRVIEDFMIQGGDPDGTGSGGTGETFDDEFSTDLQFTRDGILAMANSGNDTNDSQFFITDGATRWLDYEHTIFGFLTSGDDVRQSVQAVTADNGVPTTAPVIKSIKVIADAQNDVVLLKLKSVPTEAVDVTVVVTDSDGNQAHQTFSITPYADGGTYGNSHPYLDTPIATVEMTANTTTTLQLTATDAEGDAAMFLAEIKPSSPSIKATADTDTGVVTITASNDVAGAYGLYLQAYNSNAADTESEPLWIYPAAPTEVTLLNPSSSSSTTTNRDNSSDKKLQFEVDGVLSGTTVTIYADGVKIGSATAAGTSVTVTTSGTYQLANGSHTITAIQTLEDQEPPDEAGNYTGGARDLASAASDALTITVDLSDASDTTPPAFTSTPVRGVGFGATYTYDANTDDDEAGVTYRVVSGPGGMEIDDDTGVVTWTAPSSADLLATETDYDVTIAAEDLSGNEAQQSYTVHVGTAPTFDSYTATYEVTEGEVVTFTLTASDDNAMPLTFSLVDGPSGATVTADAAAENATSNTCTFTWTPNESQGPDTYTITVRATDTTGVPGDATITVTVTEVNQAPTLNEIPDHVVDEGNLLQVQLTANDDDLPANTLTYSFATTVPDGMELDASTGLITWTPGELVGGQTFVIAVQVSDGTETSGAQSFEVEVGEGNSPPVFDTAGQFEVERGQTLKADVSATDPDSPADTLRYEFDSESEIPSGMTIDSSTGLLTWAVPADHAVKTVSVTVRVVEVNSDGTEGLDQTLPVKISVVAKTETDLPDGTDTDDSGSDDGDSGNSNGDNGGPSPTDTISLVAFAYTSTPVADLLSPGRTASVDYLMASSALGRQAEELGEMSHVLGDSGLFGTRLAPDTGRGGRMLEEGEEEEESTEPRLEDSKSKLGSPQGRPSQPRESEPTLPQQNRQRKLTRRDASEAYDAAVEALVAEAELAAAMA